MKFEQKEGENGESGAGSLMQFEENMEDVMCFGSEKYQNEYMKDCGGADGGDPADALYFTLGYLGVKGLLSVENVCKALRDAVQNDPLLWRHIQIDEPLNAKITDYHLVQLTKRAQGSLHSLSLFKCPKITNNGLKYVLSNNPGLVELSMPGCIKLRADEILYDLKLFKSVGVPGVKRLRIGEFGITDQHLQEFKLLLGVDEGKTPCYKPRFYDGDYPYLSLDDERPIDIEICPRCKYARQVYDCPVESCQVKPGCPQRCRACLICVARCRTCGCCLETTDYEETFCMDFMCLECLAWSFDGQNRASSPCFHQKTSYHFFLYG